jgi:hypothetical protein
MSFTVQRDPAPRPLCTKYTPQLIAYAQTEWQISRPRVTTPTPLNEFEYNLIFFGAARKGEGAGMALQYM